MIDTNNFKAKKIKNCLTDYSVLNKEFKNPTEALFVLKDLADEINKTTKKNIKNSVVAISEIDELIKIITQIEESIKCSELSDEEGIEIYYTQLKLIFEEFIKLRNRLNSTSNILNEDVFKFADCLYSETDVLDIKELYEANSQHVKQEYNLSVEQLEKGCLRIVFKNCITSKMFEKDKLFFQELAESIKDNCSNYEYDFKNYNTLFLSIEQETTYNTSCVYIRDFDKANIGSLINAVVKGTHRSDFSLSMNTTLLTYKGSKNETKVFLMTPDYYFDKYFLELKKEFK